ncbi:hypothetical protein DL764_001267 [Monosporascus ibericus]|uniref:Uncharacterized protein n=1 Tax=Monosporascus ibericus TaxID=155417 RepID=A0A4Q4TRX3_9PEZI|nr:hypothetical protein DL764_001267 [Monosporascus ibericus]
MGPDLDESFGAVATQQFAPRASVAPGLIVILTFGAFIVLLLGAPPPLEVLELKLSQARNIPYLNATIEDTLRCAGAAGRLMRVATRGTEILGHKIPAGTEIAGLAAVRWQPVPVAKECRSASSRAALEKGDGKDWVHQPSAQDLDKFVPER